MRSWQVIKLGEDPHSALGILIEGPRCEDEKLVALSDVLEFVRSLVPTEGETYTSDTWASEIEREFGGTLYA